MVFTSLDTLYIGESKPFGGTGRLLEETLEDAAAARRRRRTRTITIIRVTRRSASPATIGATVKVTVDVNIQIKRVCYM